MNEIDRPYRYETMTRKIFQCSRFDDPLGCLTDASASWGWVYKEQFSVEHVCKAWVVLSRLMTEYLSASEREELYSKAFDLNEKLLNATTNNEIVEVMDEICSIIEYLDISEHPHISYKNTNDKIIS